MKILISENDIKIRKNLQEILEKSGHTVVISCEDTKIIEYIKKNNIEIIIINIDDKNGLTLYHKIRSYSYNLEDKYLYILILSKLSQPAALKHLAHLGADDFLTSPPDIKEVHTRIITGQRIVELAKNNLHLLSIIINSRNKFKLMVDTLEESIISVDKNMNILSANKAFLKFIDKQNFDEIIKKSYKDIMHLIAQSFYRDGKDLPVTNVFKYGKPLSAQIKIKKQNKDIYLKIHSEPIKNKTGEIVQVVEIMVDITKEITATQQKDKKNKILEKTLNDLKATQSQLVQSEKMASIGQLAAGVAHEINNPVGFIISNIKTLQAYQQDILKLLEKYKGLNVNLQDYFLKTQDIKNISEALKKIQSFEQEVDIEYIKNDIIELVSECYEGAQRIKDIVSDLKNFAHPGEEKLEYANINQNLDSTLNVIWNELKYKAKIIKDYGNIPDIPCYHQQLKQVFMNIMVNAAHAIQKQGEIKIITRLIDEYIEIKISDNGTGISKKNITKIFDPFFTTKDVGKGTGLGLHLVYNIIQKHLGTIEVKSKVNIGTTFIIKLPVNQKNKDMKCH